MGRARAGRCVRVGEWSSASPRPAPRLIPAVTDGTQAVSSPMRRWPSSGSCRSAQNLSWPSRRRRRCWLVRRQEPLARPPRASVAQRTEGHRNPRAPSRLPFEAPRVSGRHRQARVATDGSTALSLSGRCATWPFTTPLAGAIPSAAAERLLTLLTSQRSRCGSYRRGVARVRRCARLIDWPVGGAHARGRRACSQRSR